MDAQRDPALDAVAHALEADRDLQMAVERDENAFEHNKRLSDLANDLIYDAMEIVPFTVAGILAKLRMVKKTGGILFEGDDRVLVRSILKSPALDLQELPSK